MTATNCSLDIRYKVRTYVKQWNRRVKKDIRKDEWPKRGAELWSKNSFVRNVSHFMNRTQSISFFAKFHFNGKVRFDSFCLSFYSHLLSCLSVSCSLFTIALVEYFLVARVLHANLQWISLIHLPIRKPSAWFYSSAVPWRLMSLDNFYLFHSFCSEYMHIKSASGNEID